MSECLDRMTNAELDRLENAISVQRRRNGIGVDRSDFPCRICLERPAVGTRQTVNLLSGNAQGVVCPDCAKRIVDAAASIGIRAEHPTPAANQVASILDTGLSARAFMAHRATSGQAATVPDGQPQQEAPAAATAGA